MIVNVPSQTELMERIKSGESVNFVDAKSDPFPIEALAFYRDGQLPCAEWFKRLSVSDMLPRGKYQKWLKNNPYTPQYRSYIAQLKRFTLNRDDDLLVANDSNQAE